MTAYIRVVNRQIECVYARDDATQIEYEDAKVRQVQAHEKWHDLVWEIKQVGDIQYIVKAERN